MKQVVEDVTDSSVASDDLKSSALSAVPSGKASCTGGGEIIHDPVKCFETEVLWKFK